MKAEEEAAANPLAPPCLAGSIVSLRFPGTAERSGGAGKREAWLHEAPAVRCRGEGMRGAVGQGVLAVLRGVLGWSRGR